MKRVTVSEQLKGEWLPVSELWRFNSCRVIWKFGEFGLEGEGNTHISTGYWMHLGSEKIIDNGDMKNLEPVAFIPVYKGHLIYENKQ